MWTRGSATDPPVSLWPCAVNCSTPKAPYALNQLILMYLAVRMVRTFCIYSSSMPTAAERACLRHVR